MSLNNSGVAFSLIMTTFVGYFKYHYSMAILYPKGNIFSSSQSAIDDNMYHPENCSYEQTHEELPQELFEGNIAWLEQMNERDASFFEKLGKGQSPHYLFIGCSDSRVPAEQILGLGAGDLFVHRNIANVVHTTDHSLNAVVQYAVEVLKVNHIIVCGHYDCGGVKAAVSPHGSGPLHSWLEGVQEVVALHEKELSFIADEKLRMNRLVELNVMQQCQNVMRLNRVQKSWRKYGLPHIQGLVFDIHTGKIIDLGIKNSELYEAVRKEHDESTHHWL